MSESQRIGSASTSADEARLPAGDINQSGRRPAISLVIPAHDAQATIAQAIGEANEALAALVTDYEILIVDDGSCDATAEVAAQTAQQFPQVKVLRQPQCLGYGAALERGFQEATAPLVGVADAECQFDLSELDRLLLLSKNYEIVCGYRIERGDLWHRKAASIVYNLAARGLFGVKVRDCNCALKLFHREFLTATPIENNGQFANVELLAKAKLQQASVVEVGVTQRPHAAVENKLSLKHVYAVASSMLRFWWSNRFAPAEQEVAPKATGAWSAKVEFALTSLLLVVAAVLLFGRLNYPLFEPDESRYAQIASEMISSDDWVTPTLAGIPYLDKPPLLYWVTAISYELFGETEQASRFPCALSGFLTLVAVYVLGRQIVGGRAAWFSAAALLMCGGFLLSGRFVLMDGPLSFFCTVALLAGYLAIRRSEMHIAWWILASLACALGILTKGPVALLLCLPPLIAVSWLSNSLHKIQIIHWILMGGTISLIVLPWFVMVSIVNPDFVSYFFWKHHFVRFVSAFHHEQPWWFYLPILLAGTFPASLLFPSLFAFLRPRRSVDAPRNSHATGYLLFSTIWILLFFSMSSCKLPIYIMPAFPPLCMLLGLVLDRLVFVDSKRIVASAAYQWLPRRIAFSAVVCAMVAVILERVLLHQIKLSMISYVLVFVAAGVLLQVVRKTAEKQVNVAWVSSLAFSLCVMGFVFYAFVPAYSETRSIHEQVVELQRLREGAPVIYIERQAYSSTMDLEKDKVRYFDSEGYPAAAEFLRNQREAIVVTFPKGAQYLEDTFGEGLELENTDSRGQVYMSHTIVQPTPRVSSLPAERIR